MSDETIQATGDALEAAARAVRFDEQLSQVIGDTAIPDTAWDHPKAETIAAAFAEQDRIRQAGNPQLTSPVLFGSIDPWLAKQRDKAVTPITRNRVEIVEAERLLQEASGNNTQNPTAQSGAEAGSASNYDTENITRYIETKRKEIKILEQELTDKSGHIDRDVLEALSPIEELYDMNPKLFAEMPTSEFLALLHEKTAIEERIEATNNATINMQSTQWNDGLVVPNAFDINDLLYKAGLPRAVSVRSLLDTVEDVTGRNMDGVQIEHQIETKIFSVKQQEELLLAAARMFDTWNLAGKDVAANFARFAIDVVLPVLEANKAEYALQRAAFADKVAALGVKDK